MVTRQNLSISRFFISIQFFKALKIYLTTHWRMLCFFTTSLLLKNLSKLATNGVFTVD